MCLQINLNILFETDTTRGYKMIGYFLIGSAYILLIFAYWQYISGIKRKTIPPANPASWFVFSSISFGNALVLWGDISPMIQIFPIVMGFAQFLIARESHKKRQGYLEPFDKGALFIGLVGVVLWVSSTLGVFHLGKSFPIIALLFADAVGFYPTIRDAWKKPNREDIPVWGVFMVVGILVLIGLWLQNKTGLDIAYPAYETVLAVSTFLVLIFRSR